MYELIGAGDYATGPTFKQFYNSFKFTSVVTTSSKPPITIISPNGGETYKPGQHVAITWNVDQNHSTVQIMVVAGKAADGQYSNNGSMASTRGYAIYTGADSGSFDWTVPTAYPSAGQYLIRIEPQTSNGQASGQVDYSNNYFTIINSTSQSSTASATMIFPNGGESLMISQTYNLVAKTNLNGGVQGSTGFLLKNSTNQTILTINSCGPSTYSWTVPTNIQPGQYKIQATTCDSWAGGGIASDESNSYFTITTTQPISDWKTYKNDQYGFTIRYPKDWGIETMDPTPSNYISFVSISSPGAYSGYADISPAGPFLNIKTYPSQSTLENVVKDYSSYLQGDWINTSVDSISAKRITIARQGNMKASVTTVFVRNGYIYELTYSIFDKDPEIAKNVLDTFKFTN
jgi:hypothetical protein